MRLPAWVRIFMPLTFMSLLLLLTAGSMILLWSLHRALHPSISFRSVSTGAISLMFYPTFVGLTAPALMLLNFCIHAVPGLRRIFEANSETVPRASYRESMRGLSKVAKAVALPALALALIGAAEPWHSDSEASGTRNGSKADAAGFGGKRMLRSSPDNEGSVRRAAHRFDRLALVEARHGHQRIEDFLLARRALRETARKAAVQSVQ